MVSGRSIHDKVRDVLSRLSGTQSHAGAKKLLLDIVESYLLASANIDARLDELKHTDFRDPERYNEITNILKRIDASLEEIKKNLFQLKDSLYSETPVPLNLLEDFDVVEVAIREQQSRLSRQVTQPKRLSHEPIGRAGGIKQPRIATINVNSFLTVLGISALLFVGVSLLLSFWFIGLPCLLLAVLLLLRYLKQTGVLDSMKFSTHRTWLVCQVCHQEVEGPTGAGTCPNCGVLWGEFESG